MIKTSFWRQIRNSIEPTKEFLNSLQDFLTLDAPRLATVLDPLFGPPVLRLFAYHAYGLRTARNRSSQLKSLRIKKKGKSRGVLWQKLDLAGCTIIVGAGRGGADEMGVRPYVPGTGTRYQVPIMYCKTYYTVNTIILSLKAILLMDWRTAWRNRASPF